MLRLATRHLLKPTAAALQALQAEVDSAGAYPKRVEIAAKLFKARNVKSNPLFKEIRKELSKITWGAQRCGYCEDNAADEVEHFYPKNFYPDRAFDWENYLYACGRCNGPKRDGFAVFRANKVLRLLRRRGEKVCRPAKGPPVLLYPREENALDFIELELLATGTASPLDGLSKRDRLRAEYTIELLRLNRDDLLAARLQFYGNYRARLGEYVRASASRKARLKAELLKVNHPAVWYEMRRQASFNPDLKSLFSAAPEALTWQHG